MSEIQKQIDELAGLMNEFALDEAHLSGEGWHIAFARKKRAAVAQAVGVAAASEEEDDFAPASDVVIPAVVKGEALDSPMTGIYYSSPSPGSPAFVVEGQDVEEGQVVGLIEAMKVFNEVTAPRAGKIGKMVAKSGEVIQLGDPILYIE